MIGRTTGGIIGLVTPLVDAVSVEVSEGEGNEVVVGGTGEE